jgi:prephenate dehydrogenase
METVALLGYGRFGRAFGSLLSEAGIGYRALDPLVPVPEPHRAASVAELVAGAEYVVVAVPVPRMRAALEALRPHLKPSQLVLDVGSVKVRPMAELAEVLGREIPWVGTHPLFGPLSLALAERPLRTVVCPSPLHPEAARRVRALYERLGCEVVEQTAESHDRVMAYTHALTFFVAKGMMDAGVALDVPFAPASFKAISRTIETVRSDAGHLFAAIQRENPFSGEARRRLIEALVEIQRELEEAPAEGSEEARGARLSIPAPESSPLPELQEVREHIDSLDRELLALLARRTQLVRRAAKAKAEAGKPVVDPAREETLLAARRQEAVKLGLAPEAAEGIFRSILRYSRRCQQEE